MKTVKWVLIILAVCSLIHSADLNIVSKAIEKYTVNHSLATEFTKVFEFLDLWFSVQCCVHYWLSFVIYFWSLYCLYFFDLRLLITPLPSSKCPYIFGRGRMVVGFTTTYAIRAYHHWCWKSESPSRRGIQHYVIKFVSDLRQVGGFLHQ